MLEGLVFWPTLNLQIRPMIHHLKAEVEFEREIQEKSGGGTLCNFIFYVFLSALFRYLYLISKFKIEV